MIEEKHLRAETVHGPKSQLLLLFLGRSDIPFRT